MTRREREINAGRKHAEAAAKWAAVAQRAAECGATIRAGKTRLACDAAAEAMRHSAYAVALVTGPSPKRIASRAARRVRMARKRRRGWA